MNPAAMDSLLLPYVQAISEEEAQQQMAILMAAQAEPLINKIVARKLGFSSSEQQADLADVRSEIRLHLLNRLRRLRSIPATAPITDFRAYVVVTSYRGCAAYLRRQYPQRWRLRNRVQYLLTSQPQFGLWQDDAEEWLGGLAGWANDLQTRSWLSTTQLQSLLEGSLPPPLQGIPDPTARRISATDQVAALFSWADQFITLDDLVAVLARWWSIDDLCQSGNGKAEFFPVSPNLSTQVEQRIYLQKLWEEIQELPVRQRRALLLNLRSGYEQSALMLLPALRIATLRQIAAVLEMSAETLAGLWNQLPLDDAQLAEQMRLTRRQVINLRKAARARLFRKAQGWEKK